MENFNTHTKKYEAMGKQKDISHLQIRVTALIKNIQGTILFTL
jgi:hypothetical protein